ITDYPILSKLHAGSTHGSDGLLLAGFLVLFVHLLTSSFTAGRIDNQRRSLFAFEYFLSQTLLITAILVHASSIELLENYSGALLVVVASFQLIAYFAANVSLSKKIEQEIMLNYPMVCASIGLLVHAEGTWSAIVFLMFSCLCVYLSI